ncbi:aminotransferase class I/II-fold pyridoxal phosphate-dependent enzyme [Oceanicoccus sagamiensis]|uniref:Aminotransferase n=1 Tax=Oceanicoccus sagamiensis TaxID=716816 RepID=A0A1X9NCD6_9GAMM|nr:aminotransferase class I/II-fold pyridoxal phosphate-dependent enzyme [Oceanicoccus sagamiensis]ARN74704.1 aminotransferase [Oceanicoccus sagamiensis]
MRLNQATPEQLREWETTLAEQYQAIQQAGLSLDLTRGKPSSDQLDLSNALDGILHGQYTDSSGTDLRNYGGLDGIPEAKTLFAGMVGVKPEEVMIGGNSSLTLMYFSLQTAMHQGVSDADSAWAKDGQTVKFLAPVPGYDRHFAACEHLGVELIPVAMDDNGPDMDQVEQLVQADASIKGIWCVPRFSNPTGVVYSDEVVQRIAKLGNIAGPNFRVFWDNAYAVHVLNDNAPELPNLMDYCRQQGTEDSVYIFGSTSKITFAGAGVAFIAGSPANLTVLKKHLGFTSIGPDKINQLRHVAFLKDSATLSEHMNRHAAIMQPRFDAVLSSLRSELGDTDMGSWTEPEGGYFISFDSRPGLAREIIALAAGAGVKLTPAGATFPYGNDPDDKNIRLAPTYPTVSEIEKAMEVFVTCVKLASVKQALAAS